MKRIFQTILLLSIIAFFLSIVIEIQKTTEQATLIDGFCSAVDGLSGCNTVQSSKYGRIFGIDNPFYGMIGFALLSAFAYLSIETTAKKNIQKKPRYHKEFRWLTIMGCILSGVMALWFLYVQKFILGQYCVYCVVIDIISVVLLILGIYLIKKSISN